MFHPDVGLLYGFSVPIVCIACVGLLIYSNISDGADVGARIMTDEKTYSLPPLFSFSLGNTMHDMWEAKVYPLAILIGLFSGGE